MNTNVNVNENEIAQKASLVKKDSLKTDSRTQSLNKEEPEYVSYIQAKQSSKSLSRGSQNKESIANSVKNIKDEIKENSPHESYNQDENIEEEI
jgi:hypothetical protein